MDFLELQENNAKQKGVALTILYLPLCGVFTPKVILALHICTKITAIQYTATQR